ncbi:MAG: hypothetical protein AB1651_09725 [Pseudomonadota bacterium]
MKASHWFAAESAEEARRFFPGSTGRLADGRCGGSDDRGDEDGGGQENGKHT